MKQEVKRGARRWEEIPDDTSHKHSIGLARVLAGAAAMLGMVMAAAPLLAQQLTPQKGVAIPNPGTWTSTSIGQSSWPSLATESQSVPEAVVLFGQNMFNRDSTPLPQNDTTVAFDPLNAARVVGAYNDFRGVLLSSTALGGDATGWTVSTNGASPLKDGQLQPAMIAGVKTPSATMPVLSADAAGNFFLASDYYNWKNTQLSGLPSGPSGIAIARSPKAGSTQGVFSTACTGGDANLNCWPTLKVVAADTCTSTSGHGLFAQYITADKSSSVASGSVYMVWVKVGCASSDHSTAILAVKCTNTLSSCSAPVTLASASGPDFVEFPHITSSSINGNVYITWNHYSGGSPKTETVTIQMIVIAPSASLTSLGNVGPVRTVVTESQPIPFLTFPYPGSSEQRPMLRWGFLATASSWYGSAAPRSTFCSGSISIPTFWHGLRITMGPRSAPTR